MDKLYLIIFVFFFSISIISLSCPAQTKVLHTVSLCDCETSNESTRKKHHQKYICTDNAECVTNNGLSSKWIPVNDHQGQ